MRCSSLLQQRGLGAIHRRVPGLGDHAVTDEQGLPVVDGEGFVFVVNHLAARAKHVDLVRQLGADGRGARARPERRRLFAQPVAIQPISVQKIVCALEIAHALEGRAHVLVVFVALHAEVIVHGKQVQQMHQAHLHGVQIHEVQRVENTGGFSERHAVLLPGAHPATGMTLANQHGLQRHVRGCLESPGVGEQVAAKNMLHVHAHLAGGQRHPAGGLGAHFGVDGYR